MPDDAAAEPAGPVLLERRVSDGEDVVAERVTEAGEVWRWATVHAHFEAGDLVYERGPASWEHIGLLEPAVLSALRDAVGRSGVDALPPEVRSPEAAIGATDNTWTVAGRTVVARGAPTATAPALEALAEALDTAVGSVAP